MKRLALLLPLALSACNWNTKPAAPAPSQEGRYEIAQDVPPLPSEIPAEVARTPDPIVPPAPQQEPLSRSGNPEKYTVLGKTYYPTKKRDPNFTERGKASWYGKKFHGHKTASGERYDMFSMSAAHKTLPLPSYVRVTRRDNGKTCIVKVNDRGPFHPGRIIDLSYAAAARLDMLGIGEAPVEIAIITRGEAEGPAPAPPPEPVAPPPPRFEPGSWVAGHFDDPIAAIALREELLSAGIEPVQTVEAREGDATRTLILVGPFADAASAEAARSALLERGLSPSWLP